MYNTSYLVAALDSVINSAQGRLTEPELKLLHIIRQCLADDNSDDEKKENAFIDLVGFLLIIKEYIENIP